MIGPFKILIAAAISTAGIYAKDSLNIDSYTVGVSVGVIIGCLAMHAILSNKSA